MADKDKFSDGLKTILLASVGAAAVTAEKSREIINDLVKKGELTMEQGKILNEELRHNIKEKFEQTREKYKKKLTVNEVIESFKYMSQDEINAVKKKLDEMNEG